jgi:hypothetical protein
MNSGRGTFTVFSAYTALFHHDECVFIDKNHAPIDKPKVITPLPLLNPPLMFCNK